MSTSSNHALFNLYVARRIAEAHPKFIPLYSSAESSGLHYHNINHVKYILNKLLNLELVLDKQTIDVAFQVELNELKDYASILVYAAYGHDCYYDPYLKNSLNELVSSDITRDILRTDSVAARIQRDVTRLILLTARHLDDVPDLSFIEKLFLDLDLYTFADPISYPISNRAVEAEYSKIPREMLVRGRIDFLKKLQLRDKLFYIVKGEQQARENIAKTIDDLELELEQLEAVR